ncbi:MAG: methyltransferase [Prevotella sp.]|nr:methyltransferase [Prevotella sp.]
MANDYFQFKRFIIHQDLCAMKVGTDGTLLGAWARGGHRVLDIGTGTGLIALMMAQRFDDALVDAIDLDDEACIQARQNVAESPYSDRIKILNKSLQTFSNIMPDETYDAIVSNPPYFRHSLKAPDARRSVARHTDTLSYKDLTNCSFKLLSENGEFSIVIPFDCREKLEEEAILSGFFPSRVCAVRTTRKKPPKRYLLAFKKNPTTVQVEELILDSEEYKILMKDFYLYL